jgi:flagellar basal body-associated protein FliL
VHFRTSIFPLAIIPLLFLGASTAFAETDSKAEVILRKIDAALHPEGLEGFHCTARIELSETPGTESGLPGPTAYSEADAEIRINYIAPYDFRVEYPESYRAGESHSVQMIRLRGDDPFTLANPALKQALSAVYNAEYTGAEFYNGEECKVLHLEPVRLNDMLHPFNLYIRTSDNLPVHTEVLVHTPVGDIIINSDIGYSVIDGFNVVSTITTAIEEPTSLPIEKGLAWPHFTHTTTFSDYEINPAETVLLGGKYEVNIEQDDGDSFADIYHGFENPPMVVALGAGNALYSKLRFAFGLEIPSDDVAKELEKKHSDITAAVCDELRGRFWKDIKDNRYEVGRELMELINGMLTEGEVTDFYFTIFEAQR